jgi:hypothetical protein
MAKDKVKKPFLRTKKGWQTLRAAKKARDAAARKKATEQVRAKMEAAKMRRITEAMERIAKDELEEFEEYERAEAKRRAANPIQWVKA